MSCPICSDVGGQRSPFLKMHGLIQLISGVDMIPATLGSFKVVIIVFMF